MEQNIPLSKQIEDYLKKKPFVLEAVSQGIINYSALARKICKELDYASFDSVKISLIRLSEKLKKKRIQKEKKVIDLLHKSNFSILNKVIAVRSEKKIDVEAIASSKGPSGYMFFLEEKPEYLKKFSNVQKNLAIINVKCPIEIETTPGVVALIFSTLAEEDINIFHIIACREDNFLVISDLDAPLAFKVLSEKLR
ncbi:MAG: ACT domain-containing protein [Candidatus Diapherotrites archaeon]